MQGRYSMDRGMRIMGGFVLIVLGTTIGNLETLSRVVAIIVGLYAFITGVFNFCPLINGIVREKEVQRKKTAANHTVRVGDVKGLEFFSEFSDEEIEKISVPMSLERIRGRGNCPGGGEPGQKNSEYNIFRSIQNCKSNLWHRE